MSDIAKILNASEILRAQQQGQAIANAAKTTVGSNTFVFYAGFDGTNNNRDNLSLSGTTQSTAVGLLADKAEKLQAAGGNIVAKYYPGPGTETSVSGSSVLPGAVTGEALRTAEEAYIDFKKAANSWLSSNPTGTISVMDVSFSRGAIADVAFRQLVYERGLVDGNGRVLIEPGGVQFAPSLMIDPVATGAYGNLALPPGAAEHTTVVRAENEQRSAFKAADFGNTRETYLGATGNHGDAGAFYDNGLGGIYVDAYAQYFRNAGLKLGSLPQERLYTAGAVVVVHAETSIYGLPWPTYEGSRQIDEVGRAAVVERFEDGSASVVFEDLQGNRVYAVQNPDGRWGDVDVIAASQVNQQQLAGEAALAGLDLIDAVRHHNNVAAASAVIRLTELARRSADLAPLPELQAAGGALMILGAWDGLQNGSDAQKFASAARLVLGANEVAKAMNDGKGFLEAGTGFTSARQAQHKTSQQNWFQSRTRKNLTAVCNSA